MRYNEIIDEAFNANSLGDLTPEQIETLNKSFVDATFVEKIKNNLSIYQKENYYGLFKDDKILLGFVKLSQKNILDKTYTHIDSIYILPKYRKNGVALRWLIYATKEIAHSNIIADGAIFPGGQELILGLLKHNLMRVKTLDKTNGEISPFNDLIENDPDKCYIFEKSRTGFGLQFFPKGLPYTWYNLFEDIEDNQ